MSVAADGMAPIVPKYRARGAGAGDAGEAARNAHKKSAHEGRFEDTAATVLQRAEAHWMTGRCA